MWNIEHEFVPCLSPIQVMVFLLTQHSEVDLSNLPGGDFGRVASFGVYSVFACMPDITLLTNFFFCLLTTLL